MHLQLAKLIWGFDPSAEGQTTSRCNYIFDFFSKETHKPIKIFGIDLTLVHFQFIKEMLLSFWLVFFFISFFFPALFWEKNLENISGEM